MDLDISKAFAAPLLTLRRKANYYTYADAPPGKPFWYENANGLVEIAMNQGNAAQLMRMAVGDLVELV